MMQSLPTAQRRRERLTSEKDWEAPSGARGRRP